MAGLLGVVPAAAAEAVDESPVVDRSWVVQLWTTGGPAVKAAAESALLGSDQDVTKFLDAELQLARTHDNRLSAVRMASVGGPSIREAARKALEGEPGSLQLFLTDGWKAPLEQDQRLQATQVASTGGPRVQAQARTALEAGPEAVRKFLEEGQFLAQEMDNRVQVVQIASLGGPATKEAARVALEGTPHDVTEFLDVGQHVARARDQERMTIAELVKQAQQAGQQAKRASDLTKEASAKAVTASGLAKQAAKTAAAETAAAGKDARRAANAANRAAEAARGAASAARQAIGASNAANQAARIAASAAAKAASAAVGAADAATAASEAAARVSTNAAATEEAKRLAAKAHQAAQDAKTAQLAAGAAGEASRQAGTAAQAAKGAALDALEAADSADEADRLAAAAGAQSGKATKAAADARRHANEANRAADASAKLAERSAVAAFQARDAAGSAAEHASKAAIAADEAIAHAGEASTAAAQATKQAAIAKTAAAAAAAAVTAANEVFQVARATEAEDLTARTAASVAEAEEDKSVDDDFVVTVGYTLRDSQALDSEADRLGAEAAKPGIDVKATVLQGRKLALKILASRGSWSKTAASMALAATDDEVLEYLKTGRKAAAQDDIHQAVEELRISSPDEPVRAAATTALKGTAKDIAEFYLNGQHTAASSANRLRVTQIASTGGTRLKAAALAALEDGTPQALALFLSSRQYQARTLDERITATQLASTGGAELQAAAKIALSGSSETLHSFIQSGQYMADRKDQLTDTHVHQMQQLISVAESASATAQKNAFEAARAAALAVNAKAEADKAAGEARKSSLRAEEFAKAADTSADNAEKSATRARQSATVARTAADAANRDADAAEFSAKQAKFSADYASQKAGEAHLAADRAKDEALDAGKNAIEAKAEAENAWTVAIDKAHAEMQAAQKTYEDEIKKQQEKQRQKENRVCQPFLLQPQGGWLSCAADPSGQTPQMSIPDGMAYGRANLAFYGAITGITDVIKCAQDVNFENCKDAVTAMAPWERPRRIIKGVSSVIDEIDDFNRKQGIGCRTKCFTAGTKVLLANGQPKNIEHIGLGEKVLATDPVSGTTGARRVTDLTVTEDDKHFNELTIETPDGESKLTATHEHPFWSPNRKAWIEAADLRPGMSLRTDEGKQVNVRKNVPSERRARTFNFTVSDLHTYYVLAGSTPILVHNCDRDELAKDVPPRLGNPTDGRASGTREDGTRAETHSITSGWYEKDVALIDWVNRQMKRPDAPRPTPGTSTSPGSKHVEQKYVAIMARDKVVHGTVVINHEDGPCPMPFYGCQAALDFLLSRLRAERKYKDHPTLTVHWKDENGEWQIAKFTSERVSNG
ncbi:polymorphic toxin-type HINT domain-containing protein [Streptomyces sp. NPDC087440]|uniref:polymorphic toxin-type HINT domain-containing protein n=1 Tax=Streptomyces sp. NPDC087440 TaxID=3365790 RepID=UPI00381853DE